MAENNQSDNDRILEYYLHDLGFLLKERALQAKEEKAAQINEFDRAYHSGYTMAMLEVISLMQSQADTFGISRTLLRLDDIDPERDLL